MANQVVSGGNQKRQIPSVDKAKAPTLRTIGDIFDLPYQQHAFDPPIGGGGGGGVFSYAANNGLYGDNNLGTVAANGIQIGRNAQSSSTNLIAIGYGASDNGNTTSVHAVVIGRQANVYAQPRSVAIGYQASAANGSFGIAIGAATQTEGNYGISIGNTATGGGDSISIGRNASAGTGISLLSGAIAIGVGSGASEDYAVAVGYAASVIATHTNAVAIGNRVASTGANTFSIGVSNVNKITFDNWAGAVSTTTITHSLGVLIGGVRYYIMLSTTP